MPSLVVPRQTWYSSRLAKPNLIASSMSSVVCTFPWVPGVRAVRMPFNVVRATDPKTLRREQMQRVADERNVPKTTESKSRHDPSSS